MSYNSKISVHINNDSLIGMRVNCGNNCSFGCGIACTTSCYGGCKDNCGNNCNLQCSGTGGSTRITPDVEQYK